MNCRDKAYEKGGQLAMAKAMKGVAQRGETKINAERQQIKQMRGFQVEARKTIDNYKKGIKDTEKSIKTYDKAIRDNKKDMLETYNEVEKAKKEAVKYAKGGINYVNDDFFELVDSELYVVDGTYGSEQTPTEIYVKKLTDGGQWYVARDSKNINFTYDYIGDGVDIETLSDTDTITSSTPIQYADDLDEIIISHYGDLLEERGDDYYAKGGETEDEPKVVRYYFEDEEFEYAKGGSVEVETRKKFKLTPIGDIAFVFNSKSRRKGKRILVSDVNTIWASKMDIDEKTEKQLQKAMREKGSDLLTDGTHYYTTLGSSIAQIEHPQFENELEHDRELGLIDFEKGGITIYAQGGMVKVGDKVVITDEAVADSELKSNYGEVLRIYEEEIYDGAINTLVEVKTNDGKVNTANLHEVKKLYAKGGEITSEDVLDKYTSELKKSLKYLDKEQVRNEYIYMRDERKSEEEKKKDAKTMSRQDMIYEIVETKSEQREDYDLDDWKEYFNDVGDVWETHWVKKEYPELVNYAKGGYTSQNPPMSNEVYMELDRIKDWKIIKEKKHPSKRTNAVFTHSVAKDKDLYFGSGDFYRNALKIDGKIKYPIYFTKKDEAEKDFNSQYKDFAKGGEVKNELIQELEKVRKEFNELLPIYEANKGNLKGHKDINMLHKLKTLKQREQKIEDKLIDMGESSYTLPFAKGGMTFNLEPSDRKSFYGKAKVITKGGINYLQSYSTIVAEYNPTTKEMKIYDYYSPTTARHINAFLDYYGYPSMSKSEIMANKNKSFARGGKVNKKQNNEMLIGGIAGILLGIFLKR